MKRRAMFFSQLLSLVLCASVALAQAKEGSEINSLLKTFRASKPDTSRSRIYAELARQYVSINQDSAAYYVHQGLIFANSINDRKGRAVILEAGGYSDAIKGMFNKASQEYKEALSINRAIKNTHGIGADYCNLGQAAVNQSDYTHATNYYLEGLKIFENEHDKRGIGAVYISLGMLSDEMNDNKKALDYLLKAQSILNTMPFSVYHLQLMNDLGLVYHKAKKYDTSIQILNMGIAQSTAPEYAFVRAQLLSNISSVLYDKGDVKGALKYMEESLQLSRKMDLKVSECYALVNLAELSTDDPDKALSELKEALALSQQLAQRHLEAGIYETLAEFYKKHKRLAEALDATEKKDAIKDSILGKQKSVEIADLESTYELEKTKSEVNTLTLINSRDEFRTKLVIAIALGTAFLLVVVGFFYRRTTMLNRQLIVQGEELKKLNEVTTNQKEELKELNSVKDKIFSVIGHDLRSPLGNVISMLRLMEEENAVSDEYRPYVDDLRIQTSGTLDTLDKLLYWGKNSFKGIIIQQQTFAVGTIVKSNITLLATMANQKNITVTDSVPDGIQIYADISHFDFVTRNLLSNALKFTPEGGSINVFIAENKRLGFVVFAVRDTGLGMSQEEQDHLFNLDNTSKIGTREEVGTGIGLLLCKEFVEKNGGELWVASKLGEGSTFYFSFKIPG